MLSLAVIFASYKCNNLDSWSASASVGSAMLPATNLAAMQLKARNVTAAGWMGALADSVSLSQLSIPGAHDAAACYEPVPGIAKCQNLGIASQLNIGIRFLDIRCRHSQNSFVINHGPIYQKQSFEDVLKACTSFLKKHPSESIVMSIKEEYIPTGCTRSFGDTFDSYIQKDSTAWYLDDDVPTLKQARGKIVLVRRFKSNKPLGINASDWSLNQTFSIRNQRTHLRVEDAFVVSDTQNKWSNVCNFWKEACTQNNSAGNTLYIAFTSGYKLRAFAIPNINTVASAINSEITAYFSTHTHGRFGIIPMDFADASNATLIINTNF